ncbi:DUF6351 family protein [Variovorax dokdonensis]|uniref:DUF6351 family protein n=1 Tax=Variovorax dokdonensis TaxID=344883 RepID=A0ABT7N9D4_9BURK|nr:DUF6351 family protein [Variovorax dokdonensis]MDM0044485.1 DUF6351 family protein [Variovorax dokdonensis]
MQKTPFIDRRLPVASLLAFLLAACGGGSGGSEAASGAAASSKSVDVADAAAASKASSEEAEKSRGGGPLPKIISVSNRADLLSGGDALIELDLPSNHRSTHDLQVMLDGQDVTSTFVRGSDGRLQGLLTGMAPGQHEVVARTGKSAASRLTLTMHPRGGPVISGEQAVPFVCATRVPQGATDTQPATIASGLGDAQAGDTQCNMFTGYMFYYKSTTPGCTLALPDPINRPAYTDPNPPASVPQPANPCFKPYSFRVPPSDLATTTTDDGRTVPYVVRVERGVINRGIYDIAVLWRSGPGVPGGAHAVWNGKLVYHFGASTGQPRRQARPATAWTDDRALSRGHMVAMNSMSDSLQNSNRVLMSETVMMMKEHIIEHYGQLYGPLRFTIGNGCSGGSIAANMVSTLGPGLLDGITTSCTYPDSETTAMEVADCVLLVEAYQKPQWLALQGGLSPAQINLKKAAINGHLDQSACHGWFNSFGSNAQPGNYYQRVVPPALNASGTIVTLPTQVNNCELPASQVYDPVTNPDGPRCDAWSWARSIWGTVPGTQYPRDTRDNVGVQYGLGALLAGRISGEEFVTLNEIVGGTDRDNQLRPERSQADPEALTTAYRAGIVLDGEPLSRVAIIDMRGWDDSVTELPPGLALLGVPPANLQGVALFGIHHQWRSFAVRDRLDRDSGGHANQAMWRFGRNGFVPSAAMSTDAFLQMDQWLTNLASDGSNRPLEQKVRRSRPDQTVDYCLPSDDATQSTKVTDEQVCNADRYLAPHASPRQVAGGPRSEDVLKCRLRPLRPWDYAGLLSPDQLNRLQAVFPDGVCDWRRPGVAQHASRAPLTFANGPGGQPLGEAPRSERAH